MRSTTTLKYTLPQHLVSAISHLTNIVTDRNMPSDQNFNYCTTHDFQF